MCVCEREIKRDRESARVRREREIKIERERPGNNSCFQRFKEKIYIQPKVFNKKIKVFNFQIFYHFSLRKQRN